MNSAQKIVLSILVLATIGVGAFLLSRHAPQPTDPASSEATVFGASVNHYEGGVWWFGNGFYAGLLQQFGVDRNGAMTMATTTQSGLSRTVTAVSCVANSLATSTTFAQANPFGATSTATFLILSGTGQATTSTLLVGTSTQATGRTASNVSPSFINMQIATSAPFYTAPGVLVGPGTGYNSPGSGTFRTIVVGPSELIVGTATSTATGAGANSYRAGLASCSGSILWDKI